ncbi:MAG: DUF3352 domain-containing protein [Cyanobacteria bacterium J06588_5]
MSSSLLQFIATGGYKAAIAPTQGTYTRSMAQQSNSTNKLTDRIARKVINALGAPNPSSASSHKTVSETTSETISAVPHSKTATAEPAKAEKSVTTEDTTTADAPQSAKNPAKPSTAPNALQRVIKKPPRVLAVGAALLLGGGAIAYLNFSQNAPRSLSPAGTQLVPSTALSTITVTTDELAWTKLRQFGTADSQEQFEVFLSDWQSQLFTDNGYSFRRDIRPWIGDRVTLAMLPERRERSSRQQTTNLADATRNLVLVVPIADPIKAKALLDVNTDSTGEKPSKPESRTYKGIDIQTVESARDASRLPAIKSAVIGTSWLLLGNTDEGIEQAIDTYRGKRSLLDIDGYRKAATRVESPQPRGKNFAQIYLNIPAATEAMAPPAGITNRPSGSLVPLQGSEGIVATALVESDGIRFQGTSWLLPKNDLAYGKLSNAAGDMPRRLPANTLIAMSGSNLQQSWQTFSEGNTSPPFFPNPQNLKAGLLTQTGLNIDEDIMPWAAGEFAMGVLPLTVPETAQDENNNPSVQTGESDADGAPSNPPAIASAPLVMMVQTNDRAMAESALAQLDDVMVNRYRYQVKTEEFEGGSVTEWISPFQGVKFSHGWLPGNVAFFAVGEGAADAIAPAPNQPLSGDRLFQTLTSRTPNPNNGNFYIDLESINNLDGVFPLPQLPAEGPTAAIEAIGLTSTLGDRSMTYDLYVKLAQVGNP